MNKTLRRINPKEFRRQVAGYDCSCPFCRNNIEMYCTHGCPACGGSGRIEPIRLKPMTTEAGLS